MFRFTVLFFIFLWVTGCGRDNPIDLLFEPQSPFVVEVPTDGGDLSISITSPAEDGDPVGYETTLGGVCGIVGKVVEISGDASGLTVCQADKTWTLDVDLSSAPVGSVTVSAVLVGSPNAQGEIFRSTPSSRVFNKLTSDCDSATSRAAVFANISSGGDGVAVPYTICTPTQLSNIRQNAVYLTRRFSIANQLKFNGVTFLTIPGTFTGEIEGNGFRVRNFTISSGSSDEIGIFQFVNGATFSNLHFEGVNILGRNQVGLIAGRARNSGVTVQNMSASGTVSGNQNVGGLFGYADNNPPVSFSAVSVALNVSSIVGGVGGVLGHFASTAGGSISISDSSSTGNVQGTNYAGGFVGRTQRNSLTMSNVSFTGSVNVSTQFAGGLIGDMVGGTLSNCTVTGNIASAQDSGNGYIGGVAGRTQASTTVTNCGVSGSVAAGSSYVGGLFGEFWGGPITTCSFRGTITSVDQSTGTLLERIGGVIGQNANAAGAQISDCHVSGALDANGSFTKGSIQTEGRYVGGLVGVLNTGGSVANSTVFADVSGRQQRVAGLVGSHSGTTISNSSVTGDISVILAESATNLGGIAGASYSAAAAFTQVTYNGTMLIASITTTPSQIGGITGEFRGSAITDSSVNITFASPTASSVGGLVGYVNVASAQIQTSTAQGSITGAANLGGLVGNFAGASGNVNGGVASASVSGSGNSVGGLVGNLSASSTIQGGSSSSGAVSGAAAVGGLVGTAGNNTVFANVTATGAVTGGGNSVGGLIGSVGTGASISNALATGSVVNSASYTGGLVGYLNNNSTISQSQARGSVTGGSTYVGGLVGEPRNNSDISDSSATGAVVGNGNYVGGLEGGSDQANRDIIRSYSTGTVTNLAGGFTGGLSGRVNGNVSESFAYSVVTSTGNYAGGLVGYHQSGTVQNSFAGGSVKGTDNVGGVLGRADGPVSSLLLSYYVGQVIRATGGTATDRFGPLAGGRAANNRIVVASSIYSTSVAPVVLDEATGAAYASANALGTGLNDSQLQVQGNFAGYNFALPVWKMPASSPQYQLPLGSSYFYPILNWMN